MAERGRPRGFDRDQALQRAMELFWERGYAGTSLSDLKAAMGIQGPSLYAAFGSKEGLFREAVQRYVTGDGAEIWAAVESAESAYGAIEGYLMATARSFSRRNKPSGCLVVLSGLHDDESTRPLRGELVARRAANVQGLAARLKAGAESGELARGLDAEAVARFYVAVQQGMSIQARDGASRKALEALARSALAAWPVLTSGA